MVDFIKKYAHYIILVLGGLYLIGLPIFNQLSAADWNWQGVPFDAPNYYYARLREILDGYPFMGNPYFWEHRTELAPAFFLADWLGVIPMFFVSMGAGSIFNLIFWTALFIGLCYWFLTLTKISKIWSAVGALLITISVYSYLIIPVSMQVIYPVFILFLIALWQWLQNPHDKRVSIFLILASTLTFYIYTYLWQIVVVFLGLFFLYFLVTKEYQLAKRLCGIGLIVLALSLPLFVYTAKQISHPYYWDSMERIGLVYTHLPPAVVFYSGKWIILITVLWYVAQKWITSFKKNKIYQETGLFFGLLGIALLITGSSNIFTGKELETMQHIDRFTKIWFVGSVMTFLFFCKKYFTEYKENIWQGSVIGVMGIAILVGGSAHYFAGELSSLMPKSEPDPFVMRYQKTAQSLLWLEQVEKEPVVVWSNSRTLDSALSVATKHYVLFANYGILQLLSSEEVEDRYLVSQYFDNLTKKDLVDNLREFAGSARAIHEANTHNRWVKICQGLHLEKINLVEGCGVSVTPVELLGDQYFMELLSRYKNNSEQILKKLAHYQVKYLIKDRGGGQDFSPERIPGTILVYEDEQIKIYKINY